LIHSNGHTSPRDRSRRPVLRREKREELEINYHQDWTTNEQREQLENNHRGDSTTDTSRRNGLLHAVRTFGTNSLKEGTM
jgi:dTDP-glucose pyrophosphorylase